MYDSGMVIFAPRLAFGSLSNALIMIFTLKKERVGSFGIPELHKVYRSMSQMTVQCVPIAGLTKCSIYFFLYTDVGVYILSWVQFLLF